MKILAVINEKGGVGKTFVTTQFAYFCRYKLGNRVLVVDLDHQNNSGDILSQSGLCQVNAFSAGEVSKTEKIFRLRRISPLFRETMCFWSLKA